MTQYENVGSDGRVRDVDLILDQFAERWKEAKESGCEAILFSKEKWFMIDLLLNEAHRSSDLRRELIAARMGYKRAQNIKADESSDDDGDVQGNVITFIAAS